MKRTDQYGDRARWAGLSTLLLTGLLAVGNPRPSSAIPWSNVVVAPTAEIQPSATNTPEVSAVDPPRAAPGSQANLKITGKNFAQGAKVAFSNPGIRVLETRTAKSTELTALIQIAADAPTGTTGLFVVNPDDSEVEVPFEVTGSGPTTTASSTKGSVAAESSTSATQHFEVYNLGNGMNIFQALNKPKGTLSVVAGKLLYEEGGKEVLSVKLGDIKETAINVLAGFSTGTFHLILNSGKTFNFAPTSLRPADAQSFVDALRSMQH